MIINPIQRWQSTARMSGIVVHNGTIYLSGYVAKSAAGGTVTEQTQDVLRQIDAALASAHSDKTRILQATILLADMSTFAEMNAVWDQWVAPEHTPARACVEARLAQPKWTVEIMVLAVGGSVVFRIADGDEAAESTT